MRRPFAFSLAPAAAAGLLIAVGIATTSAAGETKRIVSERGGFELEVPANWRLDERSGEGVHQARIGPRRSKGAGDYALAITRHADRAKAFETAETEPEAIAKEHASRIASAVGVNGDGVVVALPASIEGMDAFAFRILTGAGTDECTIRWLLVGIAGPEWLSALWEMPCAERVLHEPAVEAMMKSLAVKREWGAKGRPHG